MFVLSISQPDEPDENEDRSNLEKNPCDDRMYFKDTEDNNDLNQRCEEREEKQRHRIE